MQNSINLKDITNGSELILKINKKSEKIKKIFGAGVTTQWHCYLKGGLYYSCANLKCSPFNIHAAGCSATFTKSVDMTVDKLIKQLCYKMGRGKKFNNLNSQEILVKQIYAPIGQ